VDGISHVPCSLKDSSMATSGSHSPDRTSPGDITLATDTHNSAPGRPWWQLAVYPVPTPARARKKNQPTNST
jgi:hypothetical protein